MINIFSAVSRTVGVLLVRISELYNRVMQSNPREEEEENGEQEIAVQENNGGNDGDGPQEINIGC